MIGSVGLNYSHSCTIPQFVVNPLFLTIIKLLFLYQSTSTPGHCVSWHFVSLFSSSAQKCQPYKTGGLGIRCQGERAGHDPVTFTSSQAVIWNQPVTLAVRHSCMVYAWSYWENSCSTDKANCPTFDLQQAIISLWLIHRNCRKLQNRSCVWIIEIPW